MAVPADVRRLALSLPETVESDDRFAFSVLNKGTRKGIVWVWLERGLAPVARAGRAVTGFRRTGRRSGGWRHGGFDMAILLAAFDELDGAAVSGNDCVSS